MALELFTTPRYTGAHKSPAVAAVKTHSTVKSHNRARYKGKLTASGHSSPATMTSSIPVALVLASMIAGTLGILLYNIRHTVLSYHAIQSCNNIIKVVFPRCVQPTGPTPSGEVVSEKTKF